jgi:hypothetical protein
VHRAENRIQVVRLGGVRVQPQQDRLDIGEMLLRFLEKNLPESVGIAQGAG